MPGPVTAELKGVSITAIDAPGGSDLDTFAPQNPRHFGCHAQVFIGEPDDSSADSFDIVVCTPSWLAEHARGDSWGVFDVGLEGFPADVLPGGGIWFMRAWNPTQFEAALREVCASASGGPDWGSVASRIGRLLPWEFDYRYDAHVNSRYGEPFPGR